MGKSKKIVVLTGSPRENGNSFAMVEAFIKEAEASGHSITRYDAAYMTVKGCTGCMSCFKSGKACSFDDDFNEIAPAIEEADAIVIATPLYWFTFPAKIKAVIDKFYALFMGKRIGGKKEAALIVCCEEKDLSALDGIVFAYNRTIKLLGWEHVGEVFVTSVDLLGDIHKTDGVARAAALANKF